LGIGKGAAFEPGTHLAPVRGGLLAKK